VSEPQVHPADLSGVEAQAFAASIGVSSKEAALVQEVRRPYDHFGDLRSLQLFQAASPSSEGLCVVRVLIAQPSHPLVGREVRTAITPDQGWRVVTVQKRWYAPPESSPRGAYSDCSRLASPSLAFDARNEAEAAAAVTALRQVRRRDGSSLRIDCSPTACSNVSAALRTLAPHRLSGVSREPCAQGSCFAYTFHWIGPDAPGLTPVADVSNPVRRLVIAATPNPTAVEIRVFGQML
jgi:hypothetical protein